MTIALPHQIAVLECIPFFLAGAGNYSTQFRGCESAASRCLGR